MVSVRLIREGRCQIWGQCDDSGAGGIFHALRNLPESYAGSKAGLVEVFNRASSEGLGVLPAAISHRVDEKNDIWEFIKGDLRVFYFKDGGSVIVCTECRVKKSKKVDPAAIRAAVSFKQRYFEAKATKNLQRLQGIKR